MLEHDESEVEQYLARLLAANDLQELDSWMQIVSSAEFAVSSNHLETAESLYKLALDYAEDRMSAEVVVNALLCLSTLYRRQNRTTEADTAYARAIVLFNDVISNEQTD